MKIETKCESLIFDVRINGLRHLMVELDQVSAFHSYIDNEFKNPHYDDPKYITRWFIEFYLKSGQTVTAEYDTVEKWKAVLEKL